MKKLLIAMLAALWLCSCSSSVKPQYPYDIVAKDVDMSGYGGVSSTKHNFKLVTVTQLFNVIDERSSGIFYLGRTNCGCCQQVTRYVQKAAEESGVTVYYIDVYNEEDSLMVPETLDKLKVYMEPILNEEEGEKVVLTPQLFAVIDGQFAGSQICYDGIRFDAVPTEAQIDRLVSVYKDIMKPFRE